MPAVSKRSFTASRRPGGGDSTVVMKTESVEGEIDVGDEDGRAEEKQDEAEQREAEDHVLARERGFGIGRLVKRVRQRRLGEAVADSAASTGMAAKSRAAQRSAKGKSSAERRGDGAVGGGVARPQEGA